jgi:hypothetical protein
VHSNLGCQVFACLLVCFSFQRLENHPSMCTWTLEFLRGHLLLWWFGLHKHLDTSLSFQSYFSVLYCWHFKYVKWIVSSLVMFI